jgi:hypothetical protein
LILKASSFAFVSASNEAWNIKTSWSGKHLVVEGTVHKLPIF